MFLNTLKNDSKSHENRPKMGICREICPLVVLIHYNYTELQLRKPRLKG